MADTFKSHAPGLESPAFNALSVTPSDSVDLDQTTRAVSVGVAGDVSVETAGGQSAVVIYMAAGVPFPVRVTRINATGTTATGIVAYW